MYTLYNIWFLKKCDLVTDKVIHRGGGEWHPSHQFKRKMFWKKISIEGRYRVLKFDERRGAFFLSRKSAFSRNYPIMSGKRSVLFFFSLELKQKFMKWLRFWHILLDRGTSENKNFLRRKCNHDLETVSYLNTSHLALMLLCIKKSNQANPTNLSCWWNTENKGKCEEWTKKQTKNKKKIHHSTDETSWPYCDNSDGFMQ